MTWCGQCERMSVWLSVSCEASLREDLRAERQQHDGAARHRVDEVVVGRQQDREQHEQRQHDARSACDDVAARLVDGDADEQCPAEVEAGDGRELIDKVRAFEGAESADPSCTVSMKPNSGNMRGGATGSVAKITRPISPDRRNALR